jgi:hypothetical protein
VGTVTAVAAKWEIDMFYGSQMSCVYMYMQMYIQWSLDYPRSLDDLNPNCVKIEFTDNRDSLLPTIYSMIDFLGDMDQLRIIQFRKYFKSHIIKTPLFIYTFVCVRSVLGCFNVILKKILPLLLSSC